MKFEVERDDKKHSYPVFTIKIKEDEDEYSSSRLLMQLEDMNENEVQDLVDKINVATGTDLG